MKNPRENSRYRGIFLFPSEKAKYRARENSKSGGKSEKPKGKLEIPPMKINKITVFEISSKAR